MDLFNLSAKIGLDTSEYEKGLNQASHKTANFSDKLKTGLSAAAKAGSVALKGLAKIAEVGAVALGAASAAVTAFAKSSIDAGIQFDSSMSQVAAISGATGENFDQLREKALEMGSTTKFSASEAADAMTYMAMAGWKTEDMLGGIAGIMDLAAASGEDLATTSDIVTDALTAFGMQASDSGRFADVLAAASSNANTNVGMMGETFKYVAPVAGALGYTAEDTALAIGLMANSGIKASQAGTSLRSMLSRMAKPTTDVAVAMEELGISLDDGEGGMKSFKEIMDDLRSGFGELAVPQDEFQQRLSELNVMLENGEIKQKTYDKELERLIGLAYGAEGAQKAEYAAMLAGQEAMSGLLAIVSAAPEDYEKLTQAIYECDGASAQMAKTMQDNLAGDITSFKPALEGAQILLSDQLTPGLREFVQFGTDGVRRLSVAFQEGGLDSVMEEFGSLLSDAAQKIMEQLPQIIEAGAQILQSLIQGVVSNLPLLMESASKILEVLITGITQNLPTLVSAAVELIKTLVSGLIDNLPQIIEAALEIVMTLLNGIIELLPELAEGAIQIILSLANGIMEALPELIPAVVSVILTVVETLLNNLGNLIDAAIGIIMALADGLIEALPNLIDQIPVIIDSLIMAIAENLPKLLMAGIELIINIRHGVLKAAPNLIKAIPEILGSLISGIISYYNEFVEKGKELVLKVGEGFKSMIGNALNWGRDLIDNFISGITAGIGKIKDAVSNVANTVKGFLGFSEPEEGPLSNFHTYAPDMMQLFAKGIRDNKKLLENAFEDSLDFGTATIDAVMGGVTANYTVDAKTGTRRGPSEGQSTVINQYIQAVPMTPAELARQSVNAFDRLRWA